MSKKALVLSGGSIKGAFQAGAVEQILATGFVADAIYGISVGSLNGGFLTDRAGRQTNSGQATDWPQIGRDLTSFWTTRITDPEAIAERKGLFTLAWQLWRKTFNGLSDTSGLHRLVRELLDPHHLRTSPVRFGAGSINMVDGRLIQATNDIDDILEYIIASAAIPVVMPFSRVNRQVLVDGGVRDVAPLKFAIDFDATEIWCVICQAERLEAIDIEWNDLMPFTGRLMEIVTNELVNTDLEYARLVNAHTPADGSPATEGPFIGKRRLNIKVVRPARQIDIQLDSFTPADIQSMIDQGRRAAQTPVQL